MKRVLYLDSYCRLDFSEDEFQSLSTVIIDNIEYKRVKLLNGVTIVAPIGLFHKSC